MDRTLVLRTILVLYIAVSLGVIDGFAQAKSGNLRKELSKLGGSDSDATLAYLFTRGNENIAELIELLGDSDESISSNAQKVIRYLGNERGMNAIRARYRAYKNSVVIAGPVPVPLSSWDYEFLDKAYLQRSFDLGGPANSYFSALSLDESNIAKQLRDRIQQRLNERSLSNRFLSSKSMPQCIGQSDQFSPAAVLRASYFLDEKDKAEGEVRLLAETSPRTLRLVSVSIGRVPLAEMRFHLVFKRKDHCWEIVSITQVSIS